MSGLINTRPIMALASLVVLAGADAVLANERGKPGIEPRKRYLLLDERLISSVDNAALRLGVVKKHPGNTVFVDELPWEIDGSHLYPNVVFDPGEKVYLYKGKPTNIVSFGTVEARCVQRSV